MVLGILIRFAYIVIAAIASSLSLVYELAHLSVVSVKEEWRRERPLSIRSTYVPPAIAWHYPRRGPRRRSKFVLVLDLDETLVHTTTQSPVNGKFDLRLEIVRGVNKNNSSTTRGRFFYVYKRPYVQVFLNAIAHHYEICIFTSGLRKYADHVVDFLDRDLHVSRRYFRDSCTEKPTHAGVYIKDLSLVSPSDLSKTILIDNSIDAFQLQRDNGIAIVPWYDDPNDQELLNLLPFLMALRCLDDVRPVLKRHHFLQQQRSNRSHRTSSTSVLSDPDPALLSTTN